MTEIPAALVAGWWRILAEHETRDGVCVLCGVRRCRPRADAFAELVVHGLHHRGPPRRTPEGTPPPAT